MAKANIDLVAGRKKKKRKIRNQVGKGSGSNDETIIQSGNSDETRNPNTCTRRKRKSGEKRLTTGNRCNTENLLQIKNTEFILVY